MHLLSYVKTKYGHFGLFLKKVQSGMSCVQTLFITAITRNLKTWYQKTFQDTNNARNLYNPTGQTNLSVSKHKVQIVNLYFGQHPTRSLREAAANLGIPHSAIPKILKTLVDMFTWWKTSFLQLQQQEYTQRGSFFNFVKNVSSDSVFLL